MYAFLRPLLNKGGAGRYVSRQETAERLLPLRERYIRLIRAYADAIEGLGGGPDADRMRALLPAARTELAKLNETLWSAGGRADYDTQIEPGELDPGRSPAERLFNLLDAENGYHDALTEEIDAVHHQERTRGIITACLRGSEQRLDALREITNRHRRPARAT